MRPRPRPTEYTLILKETAGNQLRLYCPELEIHTWEDVGELTAERLTTRVVEHWRKIDRKLSELEEGKHPYPTPLPMLKVRDELGGTSAAKLSTSVAAKRLGVSISTVKRLVDEGVLRAEVSEGGHRKIFRESLDRYEARAQSAGNT